MADVVADIAEQYARRDGITAALDRHPAGRRAPPALARHIQVRDRTCTHPGCRRPARKSDLDHTCDHVLGGPTTTRNIGPACARHHLYKHDLGWRLGQPTPGTFEWTSPLGQLYRTRGEPISPRLPGPQPCGPDPHEPPDSDDIRGADDIRHADDMPSSEDTGGSDDMRGIDEHPIFLRLPPIEATPRPPPVGATDREPPPF